MANPDRGDVWIVDLGMVAKVRPCLVLSVPFQDQDRALVTVVPHTTSLRGSRFEVTTRIPFLKPGAFDAQNLLTVSAAKLTCRLGTLTEDLLSSVEAAVRDWLDL